MNGQPIWMLVDSGCECTTICKSWALKHKLPLKPIGQINIKTAAGTKLTTAFVTDINVDWMEETKRIRVMVLEGNFPALLGMDMLEEFNAQLNVSDKTIKSVKSKVVEQLSASYNEKRKVMELKYNFTDKSPKKIKESLHKVMERREPLRKQVENGKPKAYMRTTQAVEIPPEYTVLVRIRFDQKDGDGPFLFEPNNYLRSRKGVTIFNSICDLSQKWIYVTNFTNTTVKLFTNTVIAHGHEFTPAEDSDKVLFMTDEDGIPYRLYTEPFPGAIEIDPAIVKSWEQPPKTVELTSENVDKPPTKRDIAYYICQDNYADLIMNDVFASGKDNKTLVDYPIEFNLQDQKCVHIFNTVLKQLERPELDFDEQLDRAAETSIEEFVKCLNVGDKLDNYQKVELGSILIDYKDNFTTNLKKVIAHKKSKLIRPIRIDTGDATPVSSRYYRKSAAQRDLIEEQVREMLESGVIRRSKSPWCSPVVLVDKKNNSKKRFCIDFRKLNEKTKTEKFPIPRIDEALDALSGSQYFSSLDFNNAYWQLPLHKDSMEKTAFSTTSGHYEFLKLPFGLKNAVAAFSSTISHVLGRLKWTSCFVYLDDIVVFGRTFEEHNQRLREVLQCVCEAGFMLNPKKCFFGMHEINYLGHIVNKDGVRPGEEKSLRIKQAKRPTNVRQMRSFLGMCNYFRRFIPDYGNLTAPLNELIKKSIKWVWTPQHEQCFEKLKTNLSSAPLLTHWYEGKPVVISTDASQYAIGAVLKQIHIVDGVEVEKPVAYYARCLKEAERRYGITAREALAIVDAVKHWQNYLDGRQFKVVTDHQPLKSLLRYESDVPQIKRFQQRLSPYTSHMTIEYKKGKDNEDADFLSRLENLDDTETGVSLDTIYQFHTTTELARSQNILEASQQLDDYCTEIKSRLSSPEHDIATRKKNLCCKKGFYIASHL